MRSLLRALILSCAAIPFTGSGARAAFTVTSPDPLQAVGYLADIFDQSSLVPGALPVPSGGFTANQVIGFGRLQIHSDYAAPHTSLILFDLYASNGTTPDTLVGTFGIGITNLRSDGSLATDFETSRVFLGLSPSQSNATLDVGTTHLSFYLTNFRETDPNIQPTPALPGLALVASALPFAALLRRRRAITG